MKKLVSCPEMTEGIVGLIEIRQKNANEQLIGDKKAEAINDLLTEALELIRLVNERVDEII